MNEWLSLRRTRTRDIDYNTMPKLERKDNLNQLLIHLIMVLVVVIYLL
jgi:hypothetical protein